MSKPPLFCMLAFLLIPAAWGKGVTARIVVSGDLLPTPIVITDQRVLEQFSIWSGPNSRFRVQGGEWQTDYSRIFIDFPAGVLDEHPAGVSEFNIEFFQASTWGDAVWDDTYSVRYAFAAEGSGGFFYLPRSNPFIHHGVEGHWLRSTAEWEASVRPLIERAMVSGD